MISRILDNGHATDVPTLHVKESEVVDTLTITITNLSPTKPRCTFDKPQYQPKYSVKKHPFDIDYRTDGYQKGKYLQVIFKIDTAQVPRARFIPATPGEKLEHQAVTCANDASRAMLADVQDCNSAFEVSFLVLQTELTAAGPATFNLGFRFTDEDDPTQHYDNIYDPTIPNDGS